MEQKIFLIIYILVLVTNICAFNSYIYLPDKYIQEEIAIGSLIVDLSEEINSYNQQQSNTNSKLNELNSIDSNENLHFTFLDDVKSSTENTYFLLDPITGRVTSKRYLDRESMCMNKHCMEACSVNDIQNSMPTNSSNANKQGNCKMNLKILIIPSYNIFSLNIIIQDINDNKPQFRIELINQSIPENVPIGYKIPIDLAYDPDIGLNSIKSYSFMQTLLTSSQTAASINSKNDIVVETFELEQNANLNELSLIVKRKLDREQVSQYNVTIEACDGGVPCNCGILKLILNIVDINDHNPIFEKEIYSFSLFENDPVGTLIGRIKAIDLDDDSLNGKIKYSLISISGNSGVLDSKSNLKPIFDLNADSGELRLNMPIDFEIDQFFSLNVEARDMGVGSLPAYATIEISVMDINDNSPEISVSFLNSLHRNFSNGYQLDNPGSNVSMLDVYISENTESNKFIAHVSIVDRDSFQNAQLDWSILLNQVEIFNNKNNEQIQPNLLKINKLNTNSFTINTGLKSNELFDRENNLTSRLNVSIVSRDHGSSISKNSNKNNMAFYNFSIILIDQNDNSPQFELQSYEFTIDENNQPNEFIYEFEARDPDENENGQITYLLEFIQGDKDFVYIEESTGILRAGRVFDRELKNLYEFYVIAIDKSLDLNNRKSSKVKCVLKINDLNDNVPRITYNSTAISSYRDFSNATHLFLRIDENIPVKTNLVKFNCQDLDQNENSQVKFILINNNKNNNNNKHSIESTTLFAFKISDDGKLFVSKRVDREQQDTYDLTLTCEDMAHKQMNRLNSSINLIIKLIDINDNCPRNLNQNLDLNKSIKKMNLFKVRFFNRDQYLVQNDQDSTLFNEKYLDDDIGKNSELKFELENHNDLFKLIIIEPKKQPLFTSNQIYSLKIMFKQLLNTSQSTAYLNSLKLGKYVIKVKISDNGNPSCIKNEKFVLYVADNQTRTQAELIDKLNMYNRKILSNNLNSYETTSNYVYEDDDSHSFSSKDESDQKLDNKSDSESEDDEFSSNGSKNLKYKYQQSSNGSVKNLFILYCFVSILILLISALFLAAIFIYCRRYLNKKKGKKLQLGKKKSTKKSPIDMLKVNNYREIELDNSKSSSDVATTTNSTSSSNSMNGENQNLNEIENEDLDDDNILMNVQKVSKRNSELNTLLESCSNQEERNLILNRLSNSFKSTDQSKSVDSVASNLTFARDITNSNSSSSSTSSSHCDDSHHKNKIRTIGNNNVKINGYYQDTRNNYIRFNNSSSQLQHHAKIYNTLNSRKPRVYDDIEKNYSNTKEQEIQNRLSRESISFLNELISNQNQSSKYLNKPNIDKNSTLQVQIQTVTPAEPNKQNKNITFLTSFPQRLSKYQPQTNSNEIKNSNQSNLIKTSKYLPEQQTAPNASVISASTTTTASYSSSNIISPSSSDGSDIIILPPSTSLSVTSESTSTTCEEESTTSSTTSPSSSSSSPPPSETDCYANKLNNSRLYIENALHLANQNQKQKNNFRNQNERIMLNKYANGNNLRHQYVDNSNNIANEEETPCLYLSNNEFSNNSDTLNNKNNNRKQHYLRSSAV